MSILPVPDHTSTPDTSREYLCEDSDFQTDHPAIYEYLARVMVEGHPRRPSRMVVYYEDAQCVLLLTDPHSGKILFHVAETVAEGLDSLNTRLAEPPVKGWKKDKRHR